MIKNTISYTTSSLNTSKLSDFYLLAASERTFNKQSFIEKVFNSYKISGRFQYLPPMSRMEKDKILAFVGLTLGSPH